VPPEGNVGILAGLAIAFLAGCYPFFPLGLAMPILVATFYGRMLWTAAGKFQLRLQPETFLLQWNYLGWEHRVRGRTTEIREVTRCPTNMKVNNRPVYTCGLVMERSHILFGTWLRERDKEAVIEAINDYLNRSPPP